MEIRKKLLVTIFTKLVGFQVSVSIQALRDGHSIFESS
jgi:hypothetical protein